MLRFLHAVIVAVFICLLSACSTIHSAKSEDETQKTRTAKVNAQLGIAYLERHNDQRAKEKLLLAIDQAPNIPETWYSMAYYLEATGNKDDASIYYQKAIAVAPARGDAQNNYGTFLCRGGNYRGAIDHFLLAVKDPKFLDPADAYENAGLCALKIPDRKLAREYFAQAVKQDPTRPVSKRKLADLTKYSDTEEKPAVLTIDSGAPPKRIAYNSLRQRQNEEDDEGDSGLVKVSDLLKAKQVASLAPPKTVVIPHEPADAPVVHKPVVAQKQKMAAHKFNVSRVALKTKRLSKRLSKQQGKQLSRQQVKLSKQQAKQLRAPRAKLAMKTKHHKHHAVKVAQLKKHKLKPNLVRAKAIKKPVPVSGSNMVTV